MSSAHERPGSAVRLADKQFVNSKVALMSQHWQAIRAVTSSAHWHELSLYDSCIGDCDLRVSAGGDCICHRHSSCLGRLLGLPQSALSPVVGGGHCWLLPVWAPDADWAVWGRSGQPLSCGRLPRLPGLDLLPRSVIFPGSSDFRHVLDFLHHHTFLMISCRHQPWLLSLCSRLEGTFTQLS